MKIKPILLPLLMLAPLTQAKVLHVESHGFFIENQIQVAQKPDVVWNALVKDIGQWWPADHTWWGKSENLSITPKAGGCFCEIFGPRQAEHMRISFVDPKKLLRMTGGLGPLQGMGMYGALDWQLKAGDNGTIVTLTYKVSGINPDGYEQLAPIVDQVQGIQLGGLKTYLDNQ